MSKFIIDVESDGPCPGLYSMVSFGVVKFEKRGELKTTFYSNVIEPISDSWLPDALAISSISREEHLNVSRSPIDVMREFKEWLHLHNTDRSPQFFSDNNGFDWQFINYYFHVYSDGNPFGFSSQNIGSLYKGQMRDMRKNFKHLRKTKHTHNPVDDAKGNAEAMQSMGWFE